MKKALLTAAAVSMLATSSAYAAEDSFYLKTNLGWTKFNRVDKLKGDNCAHVGLALGYNIIDQVRMDINFDHFIKPGLGDGGTIVEGNLKTVLLNSYVDIYKVDAMKVFLGLGVGLGRAKAKETSLAVGMTSATETYNTVISYTAHLGVGYEIIQGITGEVTYSFRNMGRSTKFATGDKRATFRGHNVTAGIRFDM